MTDSVAGRLACVFGGAGFIVFMLAAFSASPDNAWLVQWIALGGLAVCLLALFAAALVWAIKPEAIESTRKEENG